ncbi:hypothetical protein FISHEDRAFT_72484 [Fistulina hepatica ATCC 64428]|uniref:Protein kinase domain-containing protein n=1 Tax=Fistulina hepatica ATCC 64428 TaxID=1128425 RepID=A0A0D7AEQ9_9AGAR|nr:hypothetical protein FISHEDRAFT_72484 [Fistulina hepatica ATCC 64428]
MDPDLFIDTFLGRKKYPKKKKIHSLLRQISETKGKETDYYPPIVQMLRALMPTFHTRSMSRNVANDCAPGRHFMGVVTATQMPSSSTKDSPILFSQTDLITEFKVSSSDDPFIDPQVGDHDPYTEKFRKKLGDDYKATKTEQDDTAVGESCLQSTGSDEGSTWGQILDYVTRVYSTRPRSCLFCIWMSTSHARLMRFDPSGVIVTRSFLYVPATDSDTSPLARFLHNFREAKPEKRGIDPTVHRLYRSNPADFKDIERIRAKLGDYNPLSGDHTSKDKSADVEPIPKDDVDDGNEPSMYRIAVYNREGKSPKDYLAWCPFKLPHSPRGRMTSAFPAISRLVSDDGSDEPVFLKSCFRDVNAQNLTEEIEILLALEKKHVEHVPRYVYGGYVPQVDEATQMSLTQEVYEGMTEFRQYRFVCTPLCRPLSTAVDVKQFAEVLADAFEAHRHAWEGVDPQLRVLHRDISDNNIQIGPDGRGYLNDWDFSIIYASSLECTEPHRFTLIGTWYFIATMLLRHPGKVPHRVEEDLESFFWVVVYLLLKYFPVKETPPAALHDLEENFFGEVTIDDTSGQMTGGIRKHVHVQVWRSWLLQLDVEGFPAFKIWVHQVALRIRRLWRYEEEREEALEKARGQPDFGKSAPEDIPELSTHGGMSQLFMELVQSLEADETQGARLFPPEEDRFLAAHNEKKLKSVAAGKEQAKRKKAETLQRNSGSLQQREAQQNRSPPLKSSQSTFNSESFPKYLPYDHDSNPSVPHATRRSARLATKLAGAVQVPPESSPSSFVSSSRKRNSGDEPHEEALPPKRARSNKQAPSAGPSRSRGNVRACGNASRASGHPPSSRSAGRNGSKTKSRRRGAGSGS